MAKTRRRVTGVRRLKAGPDKNTLAQLHRKWKKNCHKPLNLRRFMRQPK
jgi:hypothetical protein